jgi:mono/diheme cytochrome c family protein
LSATALPPTEAAATEVLAEATATLAPATATLAEPAAAPVGDAANGAVLFATFYNEVSFACATCHNAASADRLIGPGMLGISVRAATRVDGLTASEYLHTSIVNPSAYVVPDYPDALMPKTYADVLTEAEINDLVAYLLSL